jgi:hypothetical protein
LGSTTTVNAKDRLPSSSIPIYNMHGDMVANATHDIWSGSVLHAIEYDETGSIFIDRIWTGTHFDGTAEPGEQLGTALPEQGDSTSSDLSWFSASRIHHPVPYRLNFTGIPK